jgi:hypothetical protein
MINAKREAKLKDRAFQRTIEALVHDYDRCSPVNTKVKRPIFDHDKQSPKSPHVKKPVKIHYPWGSPKLNIPEDVYKYNAEAAKKYWKHFFALMKKQKKNDDFVQEKFEPMKDSLHREKIDLSVAKQLTHEEMEGVLWHVGNRCVKCTYLDISYLQNLTPDGVRVLTLGPFGKNVTHLVAKKCASLYTVTMKLIATRLHPLVYCDLSSCKNIEDASMRHLIAHSSEVMKYLCISRAKRLTTQTLMSIAGIVTTGQMKTSCRSLESLDASYCTKMKCRGFVEVGNAVHKLRFINLEGLKRLSDLAVVALAKGSPNLQVLNLTDCWNVGDVAMSAIGIHCPKLLSLNLTRCYKITNRGIVLLSEGTPALQALNLTSVRLVNEHMMLAVSKNCTVLCLLVLENCQSRFKVTTLVSLRNVLTYARVADEFYGLKPMDHIIYEKLKAQTRFFKDGAATHIQCMLRVNFAKKMHERKKRDFKNSMSSRIGRCARLYILKKRTAGWACEYRRKFAAAQVINGNARVFLARQKMKRTAVFRQLVKRLNDAAARIQGLYRGYFGRFYDSDCSAAYRSILALRELLRRRRRARSATCIQRMYRGHLGRRFAGGKSEEDRHRESDVRHAVLRCQCFIRMANAIVLRRRLYAAWYQKWRTENKAAEKIQCQVRIMICRRIVHEERLRQRVEGMQRNLAVAKIGSMWKTQSELKKDDPFEYKRQFDAASQIQALYRGSKIQHWKILKDLPFRRAVMHKRMMESTVARGRADNRLYLRGMQGDSASESDEDWEEYYDEEDGTKFWWSLKENRKRFDNPYMEKEWERSLVGMKARVRNNRDGQWIQAGITKFNPVKGKHRFVYPSLDGGYEWINVRKYHERVMMLMSDESTAAEDAQWCMMKQLLPTTDKERGQATAYDYWKMYKRKRGKGKYR